MNSVIVFIIAEDDGLLEGDDLGPAAVVVPGADPADLVSATAAPAVESVLPHLNSGIPSRCCREYC